MIDRLHPLLVVLCLLDLGFVHSTDAVPASALMPMWLLTIASPWLRRMQRFRGYRTLWNVGVLIVFSMLVHRATTSGLVHMLEDGLVLAVLCQVHLLNNIGDQQRPDLTFFNSFLIAFVTSFFAPDFWWSLLFIGHTMAFVPALQVYVLTGSGHDIQKGDVRAVLRDSVPRTMAICALTALVFVFWPRDFERKGWLKETLALARQLQGGMTERIDLNRETTPFLSESIALRVEMLDGQNADIPARWRAIAFSRFTGRSWMPQEVSQLGSRFASDAPWHRQPDGSWQRPARGRPDRQMLVQQFDRHTDRLLTTLDSVQLTPRQMRGGSLSHKSFAGFSVITPSDAPSEPLVYTVSLAQPQPARVISKETRQHFQALPPTGVPVSVRDISEEIRRKLPSSADELAFATATCNWLHKQRNYALPGSPGFADHLGEFLLGTAAGHCEYFATTMALVLRIQGVPCRLIGGYLVRERSEDGKARIARGRDAHAWIEVLAEDGTWHTFDPTPPTDLLEAGRNNESLWNDISQWMQSLWNDIAGFNGASRERWLSNLLTLPLRHPVPMAALVLAWLWLRRRRRHDRRPPAIHNFERALRKAQLQLLPGETPRELLVRARQQDVAPELLTVMQAAATEHERSRYR